MKDCSSCPKRDKCKTLCKRVKAHLAKDGIKSADWIRPRVNPKKHEKDNFGKWREVPFSSLSTNDEDKNPYLTEDEENLDI